MTVAEIAGPSADEFLLEVQQASAKHPWYMDSPDTVLFSLLTLLCFVIIGVMQLKFLHTFIHFK